MKRKYQKYSVIIRRVAGQNTSLQYDTKNSA